MRIHLGPRRPRSPKHGVRPRWAEQGQARPFHERSCAVRVRRGRAPVSSHFPNHHRFSPTQGTPTHRHGVADPGPIQGPQPRRRPHPRRRRRSVTDRRNPRALVPAPLPVRPVVPWARQGSFVYPVPRCLCYILHTCISEWVIVMLFFSDSCACALGLICTV